MEDNASPSPRSHRLQLLSMVYFPPVIIPRDPPNHQMIQSVAIAFVYPPELDGKTQLMKTPHTLVKGHRKIMLVQTRKLPSCWLAFIVGC